MVLAATFSGPFLGGGGVEGGEIAFYLNSSL